MKNPGAITDFVTAIICSNTIFIYQKEGIAMKKKVLFAICTMMLAGSLCACTNKNTDTKDKNTQTVTEADYKTTEGTTEKGTEDKEDKEKPKDKEDNKKPTTEATTEAKPDATSEGTSETKPEILSEAATESSDANNAKPQSETSGNEEILSDNKDISGWPDTVMLVNNKGDRTTAYLLADGQYMDRVEMRYTYDGKEIWTDSNGVEWSEVVE